MSLDIGDALSEGASRTVKRNGLLLMVLFAVVGLVSTLATQTLLESYFEFIQQAMEQQPGQNPFPAGQNPFDQATPLALPVPPVVAGALLLVTWIAGEAVRIVSDRTFASEVTDSLYEPGRNLPLAVINGLVASLVVGVLLVISAFVGVIGLIVGAVILPTILGVLFFFYRQEIAVQDKNFIDALSDSVSLTKGNRFEVFALALILAIIAWVISLVSGFIPTIAGVVIGIVVGAALSVFASAVAARAYVQLVAEKRGEDLGAATAEDLGRGTDIQQEDSFGTTDFDVGNDPQDEDDDTDPSVR